MNLIVNGEVRKVPEQTRVAALLKELKLEAAPCAVEVNKRLVPKARHGEQVLRDGDRVEIVTLVGGG